MLRQDLCIGFAAFGGKRPRHGYAQYILSAERVHRNCGHHGGVYAAAEANQNLAEAAFPHVIARARHQRHVRIGNLFAGLRVDFALPRRGIEQYQILLERQRLRRYVSVGRQRQAGAIKNQTVVSPELVYVNHRPAMPQRDGPQHLKTQRPFIQVVRRCRNIDQYTASLLDNFVDRIALVELLGPEAHVIPGVFANRNSQHLRAKRKCALLFRRLEIPRFIKNVVRRQQHLILLERHHAVA